MNKNSLTPNKLQQKVCQRFLLILGIVNNIYKIEENSTFGNWSFSRWRPRWPPMLKNYHKSFLIQSMVLNLVCILRCFRSKMHYYHFKVPLSYQVICNLKMASKMASKMTVNGISGYNLLTICRRVAQSVSTHRW
jgi:hypothetical protein